jgi:hypothetical protein
MERARYTCDNGRIRSRVLIASPLSPKAEGRRGVVNPTSVQLQPRLL